LKLQEYFACGIPTIIPEAGDLSSLYKNAEDVLFYQTGDSTDLSIKINDLISDAKLREKLINAGLNMNDKNGTWKSELNRIEERIALF
jgi:glycosyltransferase involved in cell wall biosynthesis